MTTKAQRAQRRIAEQRGLKFALERTALNAARALMGSITRYGRDAIPDSTWRRFIKAEVALHEYHAKRQRNAASTYIHKEK